MSRTPDTKRRLSLEKCLAHERTIYILPIGDYKSTQRLAVFATHHPSRYEDFTGTVAGIMGCKWHKDSIWIAAASMDDACHLVAEALDVSWCYLVAERVA